MKLLVLIGLLLGCANLAAQKKFEKGYFKNNNGSKVECEILNQNLYYSPKSITYKINENSGEQKIPVSEIFEFEIYNVAKYICTVVKLDTSNQQIEKLSTNENPEFKEDKYCLRVLVEGELSLYHYNFENQAYFFIKSGTGKIEQLVKKTYSIGGLDTRLNEGYKNQLQQLNTCSSITERSIERLPYRSKEIKAFVTNYNQCLKAPYKVFSNFNNGIKWSITPKVHLSNINIILEDSEWNEKDIIGGNFNIAGGVEIEWLPRFNNYAWAIVVEPTFLTYTIDKPISILDIYGSNLHYNNKHSYLQIPLGLRRYFPITKSAKIFSTAQLVGDIHFSRGLNFTQNGQLFLASGTGRISSSFAFGFGILANKLTAEVKYFTKSNIITQASFVTNGYSRAALVLGYKLF